MKAIPPHGYRKDLGIYGLTTFSGWSDGQQVLNLHQMKRRSLVLTNEAARHPLRARLGLDRSQSLPPQPKRGWRGITAQDVREFLMAYCACFLAVSLYIA